jgi:hypothetical protein
VHRQEEQISALLTLNIGAVSGGRSPWRRLVPAMIEVLNQRSAAVPLPSETRRDTLTETINTLSRKMSWGFRKPRCNRMDKIGMHRSTSNCRV